MTDDHPWEPPEPTAEERALAEAVRGRHTGPALWWRVLMSPVLLATAGAGLAAAYLGLNVAMDAVKRFERWWL